VNAASRRDANAGTLDTGFLEGTLGFTIRLCQLNVFDDFIDRLSGLDLRPAEFSILCLIADNPGCRASRIAECLCIKRPNFVPLLSGLEQRKLVVRRRSETDGRFQDLFLTALGRRVVTKAKSVVAEQEQYMADRLGPRKRDELVNALRTVARLDLRADRESWRVKES
jgi:DNA-binding MarR family transcriptional regulator